MPEIITLAQKHHSLKKGNLGDISLMAHKIFLIEPEILHSKLAAQIHVVSPLRVGMCLLFKFLSCPTLLCCHSV